MARAATRVAKRPRGQPAVPPPSPLTVEAPATSSADLFQAAPVVVPASVPSITPAAPSEPVALPARRPETKAGVGGKLAKPGVGLCVRMPDGEDTLTPFRSLEDLLSAIKPILRATARNPETVWFSVQPVDLATIDSEAA